MLVCQEPQLFGQEICFLFSSSSEQLQLPVLCQTREVQEGVRHWVGFTLCPELAGLPAQLPSRQEAGDAGFIASARLPCK